MRKIINRPDDFVDEVLEGVLLAHPHSYRAVSQDRRAIVDAESPRRGKVGIVTGGGSGHLPLFLGYVGPGLASGVAVGGVFSSPSAEQILSATRGVNGGAGVLYLYGNYGGDIYNFDLAAVLAEAEGIQSATVRGNDDMLSAPEESIDTRRGVAGLVFAYKIAGAAAARGDDLEQVSRLAAKAVQQTRTVGVGLAPTILPAAGVPTFELDDGEMEVGVGIHGESGVERTALASANEIGTLFFDHLKTEIGFGPRGRVALLVNGLGATPPEELYILYRAIHSHVSDSGTKIAWSFIGEYATSLEMAGASVSIMSLDDELEALLLEPASSPFYRPGSGEAAESLPDVASEEPSAKTNHVEVSEFESGLRHLLYQLALALPKHADELRDLDADLGDGDLGITISAGCSAVIERIDQLDKNIAADSLMREAGIAFASANPSTFAALIGSAMISSASEFDRSAQPDLETGIKVGRVMAKAIAELGKAGLGDKTVLDILIPALDYLERHPADVEKTAAFLHQQVGRVAQLQSRRGRAAWHQARSVGLKDPGSVAVAHAINILVSTAMRKTDSGSYEN